MPLGERRAARRHDGRGRGDDEWWEQIAAEDVRRLVALHGGVEGADVLTLLAERYTGAGSG